MDRDFDERPYTEDERRVATYLDAKFGLGGGEDPIGFLIAHDAWILEEWKERGRAFGKLAVAFRVNMLRLGAASHEEISAIIDLCTLEAAEVAEAESQGVGETV